MDELKNVREDWPEFWWPAPAKLNLFLSIIGQRADGYHNLQTVFQILAISDWINFKQRHDGEVNLLGNLPNIDHSQNLIVKAACLLKETASTNKGVDISLKKILPMGAGLGGGSSNAATTLVVLNEMWQLGYSLEELANLGLMLGADVPVFVMGHSAWAEGVGEKLEPMDLQEKWYLVVNTGVHVSTKEIFSHNRLTRDCSPITIRDFHGKQHENVCLPVLRELSKDVDEIYQRFSTYTDVRLTGTGSSLFATCKSREEAVELLNKLPDEWTKWVVKGVNQSPLHKALNKFINQV